MSKSRLLRVLRVMVLLPVAVFLWTIGWSLVWVGSRKEVHAERCVDVQVALRSDDDVVWIGASENTR
jgi:hypothetical protein